MPNKKQSAQVCDATGLNSSNADRLTKKYTPYINQPRAAMKEKKYQWFKIANSENELLFPPNNLTVAEVNGKKITLVKHNGQISACAYTCPHAGGVLADGYTDATGNIVCPLHRYKFSLQNGRNVTGEGYFLKTYPVEQRQDGIFAGFEEKGFLNF